MPQPVNGPVTDFQDSPAELEFWLQLLKVPRECQTTNRRATTREDEGLTGEDCGRNTRFRLGLSHRDS